MRVAIVHDDLVQWGGAERVLEGLVEIFPDVPIFTSVFDQTNQELNRRFGRRKVVTSFLQRIPFWRSIYKQMLPLYPLSFEQFDFSEFDLVISHTTRFAKSIITKPQTLHICYCHTPPRFLWSFPTPKTTKLLNGFLSWMRIYDLISSNRVDLFLAGSENAKARIKKIYHLEAQVIYPFIDLKRFEGVVSFNGGYFLVIARLNDFKKVELAIEACKKLSMPLKIIGDGPARDRLENLAGKDSDIEFLGKLSDEMVVKVLAGARALIIPAEEDFGLTALEAQALGKPVVAFGQGGVRETVIDGKTGVFFNEQTVESLVDSMKALEKVKIQEKGCKQNAAKFSKQHFLKSLNQAILGSKLANFRIGY